MSENLRQLLWIIAISVPIGAAIGLVIGLVARWRFKKLGKQCQRPVPWWFFGLAGIFFIGMAACTWLLDRNLPFAVLFLVFAVFESVIAFVRYVRPPSTTLETASANQPI